MREEDLVGGLRSDQEGWAGTPKGRITEGRLPKGAVKSAAMGYEIYLSTFHLCGPRQAAALLKRGPILQHQKIAAGGSYPFRNRPHHAVWRDGACL
jgi:hypothetical protein